MKRMLQNLWRRFNGLMPEPEATMWRSAESHLQLGFLNADWLEGNIRCQPGYHRGQPCRPDPETRPLVPVLTALNRAGFVTDNSQPGEFGVHDGLPYRQRAFVDGWCDAATVTDLTELLAQEPAIEVRAWPVDELEGWIKSCCCHYHEHEGPVYDEAADQGLVLPLTQAYDRCGAPTETGWHTLTSCSGRPPRETFTDRWWGAVGEEMWDALEDGWCVLIVDTEWGNNERLWPLLNQYALLTQLRRRQLGGNGPIVLIEDEMAQILSQEVHEQF